MVEIHQRNINVPQKDFIKTKESGQDSDSWPRYFSYKTRTLKKSYGLKDLIAKSPGSAIEKRRKGEGERID